MQVLGGVCRRCGPPSRPSAEAPACDCKVIATAASSARLCFQGGDAALGKPEAEARSGQPLEDLVVVRNASTVAYPANCLPKKINSVIESTNKILSDRTPSPG